MDKRRIIQELEASITILDSLYLQIHNLKHDLSSTNKICNEIIKIHRKVRAKILSSKFKLQNKQNFKSHDVKVQQTKEVVRYCALPVKNINPQVYIKQKINRDNNSSIDTIPSDDEDFSQYMDKFEETSQR